MKLKESVALITGAGSGIGRAIALEYARRGAAVVCCGRRADRLEETVGMISGGGGTGLAAPADITDRAQAAKAVRSAVERFGRVDVLFNNAGSFSAIGGVHEIDPEAWWTDVKVNLFGAFLMTREVLPLMMKQNRGIIINMNGGRPPGGSGYACGKAGLEELTRLTAREMEIAGSRVLVFLAGPGLVRTEMTELQAFSEAGRKWIPSTQSAFESGRLRGPEEIASVTARLIELAGPGWNGMNFSPDTDFEKLPKSE